MLLKHKARSKHLNSSKSNIFIRPQSPRPRHIRPNPQIRVQLALAAVQRHFQPSPPASRSLGYGQQLAIAVFHGRADGHGNAHGGAVGAVDPRVIGDGEGEVEAAVERRSARRGG